MRDSSGLPYLSCCKGQQVARDVDEALRPLNYPFFGWIVVDLRGDTHHVTAETELVRVLHSLGPLCWVICGTATSAAEKRAS